MTRLFDAPLVLRLAGPVSLIRPDGYAETPRAPKLQALLVLLATGQDMTRARAFLQDKLWSEAEPAKGAASLRQALSTLRRALGEDALLATSCNVSLNPQRVTVDLQHNTALGEDVEFAAGLDVQDAEFEDWLRDRRQEYARLMRKTPSLVPRPQSPPAVLVILSSVCSDDGLRAGTDILASDIASQVARTGYAVVQMDAQAPANADKIALQVRSARLSGLVRYQVQLIEMVTRRVLWTGACNADDDSPLTKPDLFSDLMSRASLAAIRHFGRCAADVAPRADRIPYHIYAHFPFQHAPEVKAFDDWLSALQNPQVTALHLAWRARLRVIAMLERTSAAPDLAEEADAFCRKAMALDPSNPLVVALSGEVALQLQSQPEVAAELARNAVDLDPYSPFASAIYGLVLARCGKAQDGFSMARRALRLSAGMPNRSWWHAVCAASALNLGDYKSALKHAEIAHMQAPDFRPPLRFLSGLRFNTGDDTGAAQALALIKKHEPDFSLQQMADPSYPVASMRQTPLMAVTQSGLL